MGIPCADSSIATMDNQLRLLIGATASTKLYRLALGRRNERSATCSLALNPSIAIRTLRNVLISAFHTASPSTLNSPICPQHKMCDRYLRAVFKSVATGADIK